MLKRILPLVLVVLAACSTTPPTGEDAPKMVIPTSLAAAPAVEVQWKTNRVGREPMRIGDWQISEFRRGWPVSHTSQDRVLPVIDTNAPAIAKSAIVWTKARRKYSFVAKRADGTSWNTRCGEVSSEQAVRLGKQGAAEVPTDIRRVLACELTNGSGAPWTLTLLGNIRPRLGHIDRLWDGQLTDGTRTIEIQTLHDLEKVPYKFPVPVGYFFRDENHDLGAAQAMEPGTIRFADATSELDRDLVTVASAALMLQRD